MSIAKKSDLPNQKEKKWGEAEWEGWEKALFVYACSV